MGTLQTSLVGAEERAEPARTGPARSPAARSLVALVAFLVAFSVTAQGLSSGLGSAPGVRFDPGSVRRIKQVYFAAHADEFDVAFVGSSRVLRGLAPKVFDRRTAELGHPTRSYNLGHAGMHFPETLSCIEWVLGQEPERLRWLFVELQPFGLEALDREPPGLRETKRQIEWHTWTRTAMVAAEVLRSDRDLGHKLASLAEQGRYLAHRSGNVGLSLAALADAADPGRLRRLAATENTGFMPFELDLRQGPLRRRRQKFMDELDLHDERLAELSAEVSPESSGSGREADRHAARLQALVGRAAEADVELLFVVVPPAWGRDPVLIDALRERGVVVLDYGDPARHLDLHAVASLFDLDHLNTEAATRLSELVATRFVQRRETRGRDGER